MSRSIKALCLMLALSFVFFAFASCTSGDSETTTAPQDDVTTQGGSNDSNKDPIGDTTTTGQNTTTNKYDIGSLVPSDVKFEGNTVVIATRKDYDLVRDEICVELMSGGVSDSIFTRQVNIEEQLGLTIQNILVSGDNYAISNHLRSDYTANEYRYDIIGNSCYSTICYTGEGIFHNLFDLKYLDLSRPYWSQGFNEAAEIGTEQYMCVGAATISLFKYLFVTFFNKSLAKTYGDVDFYEVVNNYEWTIDYQLKFCEQFADTNNEVVGRDGIYGFANPNGHCAYLDVYWSSFDMPILTKNAEGWFEYSIDTEKLYNATEKLIQLYSDANLGTYIYKTKGGDGDQPEVADIFAGGHAATCINRLAAVEGDALKNMNDEYGIIPAPMYEKSQKEYKSMVHDQFTALAVYSRVPEERYDMIGAFLDAFAAESYKTVVPQYYDLALKNRYLQDDESAKMLDLIYESIYVDAGILYVRSLLMDSTYGIGAALRPIITSGTNSVATRYNKQSAVLMKAKLKTLQDSIKKLQGVG